eukprot:scaffold40890_cov62-Attheya_sp.AAC.13
MLGQPPWDEKVYNRYHRGEIITISLSPFDLITIAPKTVHCYNVPFFKEMTNSIGVWFSSLIHKFGWLQHAIPIPINYVNGSENR